jgi:hypothetical protein
MVMTVKLSFHPVIGTGHVNGMSTNAADETFLVKQLSFGAYSFLSDTDRLFTCFAGSFEGVAVMFLAIGVPLVLVKGVRVEGKVTDFASKVIFVPVLAQGLEVSTRAGHVALQEGSRERGAVRC